MEGLHVLHTSEDQAANSAHQGGVERRKAVSNIHPLVRLDPVTGEKSLYVNKAFGRRIVELKKEESDYLLDFLHNHIEKSLDLQLRVNWERGEKGRLLCSTTVVCPIQQLLILKKVRLDMLTEFRF